MTRLYIVRHGQSVYNLEHILQGHLNSPLTERGIRQAYCAKKYLRRYRFDTAYSSDLKRAHKTGEIILEGRDMKIHNSRKLRERDYGELDGWSTFEIRKNGYFTADISAFGGENTDDVAERSFREFTRIARKEEDKKVLITTHETMITYLLKTIDPERFKDAADGCKLIPNCSLTVLDYKNGQFHIVRYGQNDYIDEELR